MEHHAIQLARIFGPFLLITSIWLLLRRERVMAMWKLMQKEPFFVDFAGSFTLLLGLAMLSYYHTWGPGLYGVVTLLGWLFTVKGALILFAPKAIDALNIEKESWYYFWIFIRVVLGGLLCSIAF